MSYLRSFGSTSSLYNALAIFARICQQAARVPTSGEILERYVFAVIASSLQA
jgi:hypothetical protein